MTTTSTLTRTNLGGPPSPHPMSAGLCQYCRRQMWRQTKDERGLLKSNADETTCVSCAAWLHDNPGQDPRQRRNHVAERIPTERPEADTRWRKTGLEPCQDADRVLFDPDPDDDEDGPTPTLEQRRGAARYYCGACPVFEACQRTALEQGYEGLWAGLIIRYDRWTNLETRDYGPTVNVTGVARQRIEEAAARARSRRREAAA